MPAVKVRQQPHLVGGRVVFTWQPNEWPEGLITGFPDGLGGFTLEHVVSFHSRALLPMLKAALATARELEYHHVNFGVPDRFPLARPLGLLATRLGFLSYERVDGWTYYVKYLR